MKLSNKVLGLVIIMSFVMTKTTLAVEDEYRLANEQYLQKELLKVNKKLATDIKVSIEASRALLYETSLKIIFRFFKNKSFGTI